MNVDGRGRLHSRRQETGRGQRRRRGDTHREACQYLVSGRKDAHLWVDSSKERGKQRGKDHHAGWVENLQLLRLQTPFPESDGTKIHIQVDVIADEIDPDVVVELVTNPE